MESISHAIRVQALENGTYLSNEELVEPSGDKLISSMCDIEEVISQNEDTEIG